MLFQQGPVTGSPGKAAVRQKNVQLQGGQPLLHKQDHLPAQQIIARSAAGIKNGGALPDDLCDGVLGIPDDLPVFR